MPNRISRYCCLWLAPSRPSLRHNPLVLDWFFRFGPFYCSHWTFLKAFFVTYWLTVWCFFIFCDIPSFILTALPAGSSSRLRRRLARSCVICLIFGCSCASSCQLNIRHIPTESGIDFWPALGQQKKIQVKMFRWTVIDGKCYSFILLLTLEYNFCIISLKKAWKY